MTSVQLAPHQVRALDSLAVILASHHGVLIGALAIQCHVPMPRLTADVDVAILASGASVAESLSAAGWTADLSMVHRWRNQGAMVDIIRVSDEDLLAGVVDLDGIALSVIGFDLAFSEANVIRVTPATEVLVPPLPVLVLLKMISWMDRPYDRAKDLGDIAHIWDNALSDDDRWVEPSPWLVAGLDYDNQRLIVHSKMDDAMLWLDGPLKCRPGHSAARAAASLKPRVRTSIRVRGASQVRRRQ